MASGRLSVRTFNVEDLCSWISPFEGEDEHDRRLWPGYGSIVFCCCQFLNFPTSIQMGHLSYIKRSLVTVTIQINTTDAIVIYDKIYFGPEHSSK